MREARFPSVPNPISLPAPTAKPSGANPGYPAFCVCADAIQAGPCPAARPDRPVQLTPGIEKPGLVRAGFSEDLCGPFALISKRTSPTVASVVNGKTQFFRALPACLRKPGLSDARLEGAPSMFALPHLSTPASSTRSGPMTQARRPDLPRAPTSAVQSGRIYEGSICRPHSVRGDPGCARRDTAAATKSRRLATLVAARRSGFPKG